MKNRYLIAVLFIPCALIIGLLCFNAGKENGQQEIISRQKELYEINRASMEKLVLKNEGPIYVIGHKSPDTDTVVSAITFARLLNMLGYEAEARISEPVNNETKYILEQAGVAIPEELVDASGQNIFLVDHSEYGQAADGMEDAHIVGIIDHHGVGNVMTGHQIFYEDRPMGSTATIIWLLYQNYGLEIDKTTAYLLLGSVLSDTYNFGGSTTTSADIKAAEALAKAAGVEDTEALYKILHEKQLSYDGMSDEEILFLDYKSYEASGVKYGIAQVAAISEEVADDLANRMKAIIGNADEKAGVDLFYAAITMREDGLKIDRIVPGNELSESILKNAFPDYDDYDGTSYIYRSGLGRKTIFVPGLNDYLAAHPHE